MSPGLLVALRAVALVLGIAVLVALTLFGIGFGEALREWYDE